MAQFEKYYGPIMDAKLDYIFSKVPAKKIEQTELLQTLWELDRSTSRNVTSMLIGLEKNGDQ